MTTAPQALQAPQPAPAPIAPPAPLTVASVKAAALVAYHAGTLLAQNWAKAPAYSYGARGFPCAIGAALSPETRRKIAAIGVETVTLLPKNEDSENFGNWTTLATLLGLKDAPTELIVALGEIQDFHDRWVNAVVDQLDGPSPKRAEEARLREADFLRIISA